MVDSKEQEELDFKHSHFNPRPQKSMYNETGWDVPSSYADRRREYDVDGYEIQTEDQS